MTTGSNCRPSNAPDQSVFKRSGNRFASRKRVNSKNLEPPTKSALAMQRGRFTIWPPLPLFVRRRLARVGNDLIELRRGQYTRHPEFADDKGRRALEAERGGLIVVACEDRVDCFRITGEVAVETVELDAGAAEQFTNPRLGQLGIDADHRLMCREVFVLV